MKRALKSCGAAGLTAALATALILACSNSEEETPGVTPYSPTQPKLTLANVEIAFDSQDPGLLGSSLGDNFKFYFDTNDVGQKENGYVMPESWSKADFMRAAGNMFARTRSTTLTTFWRTMGSPGHGEKTFVATGLGLRIVVMVDEVNGYALDDATCDYDFAQGDSGAWRLTLWRDRSRECGCIGELTLGRILAGFYQ